MDTIPTYWEFDFYHTIPGNTICLSPTPHIYDGIPGGKDNIKYICQGKQFYVCLTNDGRVYSWGDNKNGQLGLGSIYSNIGTPTEIEGLCNIVSLNCGYCHCIAMSQTGIVYTWGLNSQGQCIIDSTYTSRPCVVNKYDIEKGVHSCCKYEIMNLICSRVNEVPIFLNSYKKKISDFNYDFRMFIEKGGKLHMHPINKDYEIPNECIVYPVCADGYICSQVLHYKLKTSGCKYLVNPHGSVYGNDPETQKKFKYNTTEFKTQFSYILGTKCVSRAGDEEDEDYFDVDYYANKIPERKLLYICMDDQSLEVVINRLTNLNNSLQNVTILRFEQYNIRPFLDINYNLELLLHDMFVFEDKNSINICMYDSLKNVPVRIQKCILGDMDNDIRLSWHTGYELYQVDEKFDLYELECSRVIFDLLELRIISNLVYTNVRHKKKLQLNLLFMAHLLKINEKSSTELLELYFDLGLLDSIIVEKNRGQCYRDITSKLLERRNVVEYVLPEDCLTLIINNLKKVRMRVSTPVQKCLVEPIYQRLNIPVDSLMPFETAYDVLNTLMKHICVNLKKLLLRDFIADEFNTKGNSLFHFISNILLNDTRSLVKLQVLKLLVGMLQLNFTTLNSWWDHKGGIQLQMKLFFDIYSESRNDIFLHWMKSSFIMVLSGSSPELLLRYDFVKLVKTSYLTKPCLKPHISPIVEFLQSMDCERFNCLKEECDWDEFYMNVYLYDQLLQ
eukprot:TRINITY_DN3031_c2_g2_i2.p1 TRINITY_DN3031_c2_g2~~TRINITY_DN3031_c2_g2_i2.p1  ORF type:complete len:730 (-),score=102.00 TRINITY_DN3031_c2_g2_i2:67-2256(-)